MKVNICVGQKGKRQGGNILADMKGSLLGLRGPVRPSGGQETVGVGGMENGFCPKSEQEMPGCRNEVRPDSRLLFCVLA